MQAVKRGFLTKWSYKGLSCTISPRAKAEDSADPAREHAVLSELIKLAKFEVFVLQDQALGGGKCHGERMLGHHSA